MYKTCTCETWNIILTSALPPVFFYDWSTWQRKTCFFVFIDSCKLIVYLFIRARGIVLFLSRTWRNVPNRCRFQTPPLIRHFWLGLASCVLFFIVSSSPSEKHMPSSLWWHVQCTVYSGFYMAFFAAVVRDVKQRSPLRESVAWHPEGQLRRRPD